MLLLLLFGLIPLIIYGIVNQLGILYYVATIITTLVFPVIPVIISNLLVLLIMSFSKVAKNKNKFQIIASIILIIVIFMLSFTFSSSDNSQEQILQMVTQANGLVEIIQKNFPTLTFAIQSLTNDSIGIVAINIAEMIGITALLYAIYVVLAEKLFLKGAVGNLSSGVKTKKLNEKKMFRKTTLFKAYVGKEFKTLYRNPIFFMQCLLPAILLPILIVIAIIVSITSQGGNVGEISNMFEDNTSISIGIILACIVQFFSMFVYLSITAISREGQNAIFMKYIPVTLEKQLNYKTMPNIIIMSVINVAVIVIAEYLIKMPVIYMVMTFILMSVISYLQSFVLILIDLNKPKLEWNSEYTVAKQNLNLMWPLILGIVNIMVVVGFTSMVSTKNPYIIIGSLTIIYMIAIIIVKKYIRKNINKQFEKIY